MEEKDEKRFTGDAPTPEDAKNASGGREKPGPEISPEGYPGRISLKLIFFILAIVSGIIISCNWLIPWVFYLLGIK